MRAMILRAFVLRESANWPDRERKLRSRPPKETTALDI